jgi:hypothetical protein
LPCFYIVLFWTLCAGREYCAIKDVVFSPYGSKLLTLSVDAAVLYRISDGMELARLESENFFNGYFTNDGKIVLGLAWMSFNIMS